MALELSAKAEILAQRRVVQPNLILEIDGVPTQYAAIDTFKLFRFGEDDATYGIPDLLWGGGIPDPNIVSLISLGGSSNTITQQLQADKGSAISVSSVGIELIDKNEQITELITPGAIVDDIVGRRAVLYLNFKDGLHPQDSVVIHRGIIDSVQSMPASVKINISHPEAQKRQELFIKQSTELTGNVLVGDTTINVTSTDGYILPYGTSIYSCIIIDDEIIKWTGKTTTSFTGCTRGYLGTVAAAHSTGDAVDSFYQVEGNTVDIALQLMLSKGAAYYAENVNINAIGAFDILNVDASVITFPDYDLNSKYGITVGDTVTITSSISNNVSDILILEVGKLTDGSYLKCDTAFALELTSPGVAKFKSRYNVLTEGAAMLPQDVDINRHEYMKTNFSSNNVPMKFYLRESVVLKDFLSAEIYAPCGFFALPRKARASIGIMIPPLASEDTVIYDSNNIISPAQLRTSRSINKNFYNAIVFKYEEDPIDEKFKRGKVTYSASSQNRIMNVGNKPMTIESKGLRHGVDTDTLVRLNSKRLLQRYEFGSEYITGVNVTYKDGFKTEVGDIVLFGDSELKMSDTTSGSRDFLAKLYEVTNKSMNIKTGEVTLDLLMTAFSSDGRYGGVSPSSVVDNGSTTTSIIIRNSYGHTGTEQSKWSDFIGEKIIVHNKSWSVAETVTLTSFDPANAYKMNVSPALTFTPSAGMIVDIGDYDDSLSAAGNKYKLYFVHIDETLDVVSGISDTQFTVSAPHAAKMVIGKSILIRNASWSIESNEVKVLTKVGTTITTDASLGLTPAAGQKIELVGFIDDGEPYRFL